MRLMKNILALLLAMMTLAGIPALAEEGAQTADLVKQDVLLDTAFSMLGQWRSNGLRCEPARDLQLRLCGRKWHHAAL